LISNYIAGVKEIMGVMYQECPVFEDTCCIGDDPILLAEISSFFNEIGHYFPVMDEPRLTREDASNEVIRRNNALAIIKPNTIIYADVSEESKREFSSRIPKEKIIELNNRDEVNGKLSYKKTHPDEILHWGRERIAIGLLQAKQTGKRLKIDLEESPSIFKLEGTSGNLVICEERKDIAPVIAANYAYSIGAGLSIIPEMPSELVNEINEEFYTIYSEDRWEPIEQRIKDLRGKLRSLIGEVDIGLAGSLTFITGGIPWGFAFCQVPTTHIFAYPDMGIHLANGIGTEQKNVQGTRVSLLIEPGNLIDSEIDEIRKNLVENGGFVRTVHGKGAKVSEVTRLIELYPYDLLVISTHADEVSGERITFKFEDRNGLEREFIEDRGLGFGLDPKTDKVLITEFFRPLAVDGISWDDPENKKLIGAGLVFEDFIHTRQKDVGLLKIVARENLRHVKGCIALRMADHNYIPSPHSIADTNTNVLIYVTPHPPLPLKGGGLGRG
jgi:hypothetical protein